jgi:hypothetical protein
MTPTHNAAAQFAHGAKNHPSVPNQGAPQHPPTLGIKLTTAAYGSHFL